MDTQPTIKLANTSHSSEIKKKGVVSRALLIGALTLLLFAFTFGAYVVMNGEKNTHSTRVSSPPHARPTITATVEPTAQAAKEIANLGQRYMQALINQQYGVMWSLLHPDIQQRWNNEATFAASMKARFQNFTLQNFTLGNSAAQDFWVNPETMMRYDHIETIPVSLQLTPQVATDKVAQLPTLDQNPSLLLQNIPLIAQYTVVHTGREVDERWFILNGGPADSEAPILPPITPVIKKVSVPIMMYHHIGAPLTNSVLDRSLAVSTDIFKQHLDYLKGHHYHTITFNQLFDALYYSAPLPENPIILTFDDGFDDAYTNAYSILKQYQYSGMFYIISGKVGWKGQATWDQLREMLANGMQMGSHTITHRDLGNVWLNSPKEAQLEMTKSRQDMETQLHTLIQQFCYPTGEPFRFGQPAARKPILTLLEKAGYVGATTDPPAKNADGIPIIGSKQNSEEPLLLVRLRVDGRNNAQAFINTLA